MCFKHILRCEGEAGVGLSISSVGLSILKNDQPIPTLFLAP